MDALNWQQMATGVGDFLAVGMLLVTLKAVFGMYWTILINRVATLALATAIPPLAIWALGGWTWQSIVLGAFNGIIVAGSLLGVNEVYRAKVQRDLGLTVEKRTIY
jgi:hypothetical protein